MVAFGFVIGLGFYIPRITPGIANFYHRRTDYQPAYGWFASVLHTGIYF